MVGCPQIEVGGSIIQRPWTGTWGSGDRQNPLGVRSKSAKNHVFDDFWSFLMILMVFTNFWPFLDDFDGWDHKIKSGVKHIEALDRHIAYRISKMVLGTLKNTVLDPSRDPFGVSLEVSFGTPRQIPYLEGLGGSILDPSHQNRSPKPHFCAWNQKRHMVMCYFLLVLTIWDPSNRVWGDPKWVWVIRT